MRGITGNRAGRMQIMGVDPGDVVGKLVGKHAGLAPAPLPPGIGLAREVRLEKRARFRIGRLRLRPAAYAYCSLLSVGWLSGSPPQRDIFEFTVGTNTFHIFCFNKAVQCIDNAHSCGPF